MNKKYLKYYTELVKKGLGDEDIPGLLKYIEFIQHERLVHLIITFLTMFVFFVTIGLMLVFQHIVTDIMFLIVSIVMACYAAYYCMIENQTQFLENGYLEYILGGKDVL